MEHGEGRNRKEKKMSRRKKLTRKASTRNFTKNARIKKKNYRTRFARGGVRL